MCGCVHTYVCGVWVHAHVCVHVRMENIMGDVQKIIWRVSFGGRRVYTDEKYFKFLFPIFLYFPKGFYLFISRERRREGNKRERNMDRLPPAPTPGMGD